MADAAVAYDQDHQGDFYGDTYIRRILRDVKTVAMVGASANWNRPSFFAMKYLQQKGFRIIPVNPGAAGMQILGETVIGDLASLPVAVDMIQIFRRSEAVPAIVEDALALDPQPKVIWMQLGVVNHEAAARAEAAGLRVVMNRCPKIEYARLSGELGWNGFNTRVITARKREI